MHKKKSILRLFLVPLSIVMLVQALVALGAVYVGGTAKYLDEYSVGIMEQIVRNRNLILSSNMIHKWSDISGEAETADACFEQILKERALTPQEFMRDEEAREELLRQMLIPSLDIIRRNGVNGVYFVLADGLEEEQKSEAQKEGDQKEGEESVYKCSGIYFRDADPYVNPKNYSDLLMERGNYEFSHNLGIPFDVLWTTRFSFSADGQREADNFFYKPYKAALESLEAEEKSLAYWGSTFHLEDNKKRDTYSMISYSIPLISRGQVYGVMGVEISTSVIDSLLPEHELNSGSNSGYLLAEYDASGRLVPFFLGGTIKRSLVQGAPLDLKETDYPDLYRLENPGGGEDYYAQMNSFSMYSPNTPFAKNSWVLMGVQPGSSLFGVGDQITRNIALAVFIALVVGVISTYFLLHYLTRPIAQLAAWIRDGRETDGLGEREQTSIIEIRALYDAIIDSSRKQKEAEEKAQEEKERYLLALQSSTDIIYTYKVEENSLVIYNLQSDNGPDGQGMHVSNLLEEIEQSQILSGVDRQLLKNTFLQLEDKFELSFHALTPDRGWQWLEISGKTICDASGKKSKVIGSIRNIQEQKEKEQMENNAVRIDPVTGLYREKVGQELISAEISRRRPGYMLLLDLDRFQEVNDCYGINFGDAILEETGLFILKVKRESNQTNRNPIAVRVGGDEILVWFGGFKREEIRPFFNRLNRMLAGLCAGGDLFVSATAAAMAADRKEKNYEVYTDRLRAVLAYGKKWRKSRLTFSEEMPEAECTEKRDYNEIASSGSLRPLNMVTRAFNLFDRGGKIGPVISVLFVKLGAAYGVSDILMTDISWDFNASSVYSQWHRREEATKDTLVYHFKTEDLESCLERFGSGCVKFGIMSGFTQPERRLLHIPAETFGYCVPMYDGEKLIGAVSFIKLPERRMWKEEECSELQEIVKIIETNANRERYDLSSRAKSDFLSRMSHEIRTPMNAIIGMTAIAMEKETQSREVKDCLMKIDQSSRYLLSLINDILDMSKIESGKMKLACDTGNVLRMAEEIDDLMGGQMRQKNITYIRDVQVEHPWVSTDLMRLKQVLINLFSNAVKFTKEGGRIRFTVRELSVFGGAPYKIAQTENTRVDNTQVEISFAVEDDGIGISEENQKRIFNAFEQAEDNTAAAYGGTGLGLSISSRIVRMLGGEIQLDSKEGQGSRFSFILRFDCAGKPDETAGEEADETEMDLSGTRILLVEDNELNTEIAKAILEMHHFEVDTAENGRVGVDKFAGAPAGTYNLILMDIRMPVMDGLEATRTIRRMERPDAQTIPIIAMTANAFDEDMRKSIESGMNGHLAKPVDVKELISTVRAIIKKNKS